MLRKSVFAFVVVAFSVGVLCADTFPALITKVEGDKITFKKGTKGEDKKFEWGKAETMTAAKAEVMKKGKKGDEPTPLTDGLKNAMFSSDKISESPLKGVFATVTTEGSTVTKIEVFGGFKGKGKKNKDK